MRRTGWQISIGAGTALICIFLLLRLADPARLGDVLRAAAPGGIVQGALFVALFLAARAIRWRYLLANTVSGGRVFHIQNIGYLLSQLLPLRLGDVARGVLIGRTPPVTVPQGLATMVAERILDMLVIAFLLPLTLSQVGEIPIWLQQAATGTRYLALVGLAALVVAAAQRARLIGWAGRQVGERRRLQGALGLVDSGLAGLAPLGRLPSAAAILGLSVLVWGPVLLAYRAVIVALGFDGSLAAAGFVAGVGALSMAAPASPGQVGVFHAGVTAAFTLLGFAPSDGLAVAVLYHLVNLVVVVLLGALGLAAIDLSPRTLLQLSRQPAEAG